MSVSYIARTIAIFLCAALLLAVVPAGASQTIRCESSNGRYKYCSAYTDNAVTLTRQLSSTKCRAFRNWGYDKHGVWVDDGCRAEFRVGRGRDYSRDHDSRRDHDDHDDEKIAAAAGLAIAIGAIVAAKKAKKKAKQEDVSSWAIGTFTGYDPAEQTNVELTIYPGGSVNGSAGGHNFTGNLDGNELQAGRQHFRIQKSGNGFLATDPNNSNHKVYFNRSGSGY